MTYVNDSAIISEAKNIIDRALADETLTMILYGDTGKMILPVEQVDRFFYEAKPIGKYHLTRADLVSNQLGLLVTAYRDVWVRSGDTLRLGI